MVYKQIKINITRPQLQKALNGKPVQFNASQIGSGSNYLSLHPANVKIVEKAAMKGSGCVVHLAPGELMATAEDMEGNGIFGDIWKGLKTGYKWTKKNVIDTDFYQKNIRPIARQAVDTGISALAGYAPQAVPLANLARDKLSKETGAFGLKGKKRTKTQRNEMLKGKGLYLS